jgi:hypothetical protein
MTPIIKGKLKLLVQRLASIVDRYHKRPQAAGACSVSNQFR